MTTRRRISAMCAAGVLTAAGLGAVIVSPAQADTTQGGGTAPVVSGTTDSFNITPDQDGSNTPLTFAATVGDVNSMENLTTVKLCLGLTDGGDTTCTSPDGRVSVLMTWTQIGNGFTVSGGTLAADATSTSGYSIDAVSQTMSFKLTYGEALREGNWTTTVTALDDDGLSHAVTDTTLNVVNWYANIDSERAQVTHGAIAAGGSAIVNSQSSTLVSNGTTAINYQVAALVDGTFTATNAVGTAGTAPGNDEFAFDCSPDDTFNEANDVRILTSAPVICEDDVTVTGTPEGGQSSDTQSVKLFVGTEWKRDAVPLYTGTVTVTATDS